MKSTTLLFGPAALLEAVKAMPDLGERAVLFARAPLVWGSDSVVSPLTEDHRVPEDLAAAGYEYLLEQEQLSDVLAALETKRVSDRTVAELVIHYAVTDAWPAWFDDLRDRE